MESEQDPLQLLKDQLLPLRSLLRDLPLTEKQTDRLLWQVQSRRYSAGDVIIREGVRGDFGAVVVRGTVAARSLRESPPDRLTPGEPEVLVQAGSLFGRTMLLGGEASDCTYRAASDVELLVLRRADLVSVMGQGRLPEVPRRRKRRVPWLLVVFLAAVLVAVGAWLGASVLSLRTGAANGGRGPVLSPMNGESVRLISPAMGAVLQSSDSVQVQAVATGAGLDRIDLLVDSQVAGTQATVDEAAGVRTIDLAWKASEAGTHTLVAQGYRADGSVLASRPVTVTVVPAGRLVFSSNRSGATAIYAMNSDGSGAQLLTTGPGVCRQPSLRDDGILAFVTDAGEKGSWIRALVPGASESVELFAGSDPTWSPSGDQLAFAQTVNGVSQVSVAQVADGQVEQVTSEGMYAGQPAWSPDGKRLAYVAERDGNVDVWVVNAAGSEPVRLTDATSTEWAPAWSPDGRHLAFVSDRSGEYQVYWMLIEEGAVPQQVTEFPLGAEAPAWSPDGYWLAIVAYTGDGTGINAREIYVVRADGGEPVRLTANSYDDTHPQWVLH